MQLMAARAMLLPPQGPSSMPFTYFAHQLCVLPLKQAKPRWFDGTALCLGSMAPDFGYALMNTPLAVSSHRFRAQLYWTLPVAWALTWLIRTQLAAPVGAQLPGALGREVRALARTRHPLPVTALSAVIGGVSHVVLDLFTHPHGWMFEHVSLLRHVLWSNLTVAGGLQYLGHTFGTAIGMWWMWRLVQARSISTWNGSSEGELDGDIARAPWFWPALVRGSALCAVIAGCELVRTADISIAIMRGSFLELLLLLGLTLGLRRTASVRVAQ